MKRFDVTVVFEGSMQYTVEAETPEDAAKQGDALFAEEDAVTIQANVAQTATKVISEVDAI